MDIQVCRVDKPSVCRLVKNVVVDTGASASAIPISVARELGITFPRRREYVLADGKRLVKRTGAAVIRLEDREAVDDIITVPSGAHSLLSVRALEGMGFEVDPKTRKLKKLDAALLL